jgi:DNA-binding beta-propeller fold protein YncE
MFRSVLFSIFLLIVTASFTKKKAETGIDFFIIRKFKIQFQEILTIGQEDPEDENYLISFVSDLTADKYENIYILDRDYCNVKKYNKDGKYLMTFGYGKGQGPGEFLVPRSIALDCQNNVYVADSNQRQVTVFDTDGNVLRIFKVKYPMFQMVIDQNDNLYFTGSTIYHSDLLVQKYDSEGNYLKSFVTGWEDKKLRTLVAQSGNGITLTIGKDNEIFVLLSYPYEIQKYSCDGDLLMNINKNPSFFKYPYREVSDGHEMIKLESRCWNIVVLNNGIILGVIYNGSKKEDQFTFDFFSPEGKFITSISPLDTNLKNSWIRNMYIDDNNYLYLDYSQPYPMVKKFKIELETF